MKSHLSPRELALAIGVSESSLKRWADDGLIGVTRTAGGHRRIARHEALRFIRETKARVLRPSLLGLREADRAPSAEDGSLFEALRRGIGYQALGLIQGWFLEGRPLAWIFDGPIANAMDRIGRTSKPHAAPFSRKRSMFPRAPAPKRKSSPIITTLAWRQSTRISRTKSSAGCAARSASNPSTMT